ncbi:MAG TPA: hypothetical protein VE344_09295 [Methylomirabilota bacterium]|nr:hypothetical protein [Methylomirabilota bacterium]
MNKKYLLAVSLTGMVCLNAAASSMDSDKIIYLDSTNRLTLSLRFGLNINAKFKGVGTGLVPNSSGAGSTTPNGDRYNYTDGYVLNDSTGNAGGFSSYWGYNDAGQYNAGANTFTFHSAPSAHSDNDKPLGVELTYDRQFGEKEDWHNVRYGLEAAVNYMKISLSDNDVSGNTDVYQFPAPVPPPPGFQGSFNGNPGDPVISVPPISSTPGAFLSHDDFNGDLFGGRLGPYAEIPLTEKLALRASGGLAIGLLYSSMSWQQTMVSVGSMSGGGNNFDVLWGGYASLDATYQLSERWGLDVGAQFQDIGKFNHSYQGRGVELDLSQSLFVEAGVSYSF